MALLDRLRRWLFGTGDQEPADGADERGAETDPAADEPRLDPDNATRVRQTRKDDPVSELQEVTREAGEGEGDDGDRDSSEGGDGASAN